MASGAPPGSSDSTDSASPAQGDGSGGSARRGPQGTERRAAGLRWHLRGLVLTLLIPLLLLVVGLAVFLGQRERTAVEEGMERPEKFRPYGLPAVGWLREVGDQWGARSATANVSRQE